MAGQDQPHTQHHSGDASAQDIDMEVSRNPQSWDTGNDPGLDGDTDGAQTAGTRSPHANNNMGTPQSLKEGTGDIGASDFDLPKSGGHGASNAAGDEERAQQEKVLGK